MQTPWTIHRMLFRDALIIAVMAVVGLTALFIVILMMQVMQKVEGVSAASLMRFVPPLASGYQSFLIPVAACAGCAMVYGRFSSEHELLATMAGGIAPRKLLAPAIWLGLLLCIPAYFAAFHWAPQAYNDRDRLQQEALADILDNPPEGGRSLNFPSLGLSFRDQRDGVFEGLVLHQIEDGEIRSTLATERAELAFDRNTGTLRMFGATNAVLLTSDAEGNVQGQPSRFSVQMLELKVPDPEKKTRASFKGDSPSELIQYIDEELTVGVYNKRGDREYPTIGELIKRLLFTFAPLFFALIGALVGLLVTSRNRIVPLGIALMLAGGTFFCLLTVTIRATVDGVVLNNAQWMAGGGALLKPIAAYLPGVVIGFLPLMALLVFLGSRLGRSSANFRIPLVGWVFRGIFSRRKRYTSTSNTFPAVQPDDSEEAPKPEAPKRRRRAIPLSPLAWVIAFIPGLKRFDRYFLHSALGSVLLAIFAICALFVAIDYLTNLEALVHLNPRELGRHYLYILPPILYMLMPLMVLLGASFALVRIIKHRELLALQVAGVRAGRALRSFFLTAILAVIAMFTAHEVWLPDLEAAAKARAAFETEGERGKAVALFDQTGSHWRVGTYDFRGKLPALTKTEVLRFDRFGQLEERLYFEELQFAAGNWWGKAKRFDVGDLGASAITMAAAPEPTSSVSLEGSVVPETEVFEPKQEASPPLQPSPPVGVTIEGAKPVAGFYLPPGLLLKRSQEREFRPIPELLERAQESRRPAQRMALYRALTYPFYALSLLMLGLVLALRFNARSAFVAGALTLTLALSTYAATFVLESLALKGVVGIEFASIVPASLMLIVGFSLSTFLADKLARR